MRSIATLSVEIFLGVPLRVDKDIIRALADNGRCSLVAIGIEAIRQHLGQLELERHLVLGLVARDHHKGRFAATLRPMDMLLEF